MEIKKINKLLLGIFVLHVVIVALMTVFPDAFQIGIILNLSLGEVILFVPTLVYLFFWVKSASVRNQEYQYRNLHVDEINCDTSDAQLFIVPKETI